MIKEIKLRDTRTLSAMARCWCLNIVQQSVDPRAHIYNGELRYSVNDQKGKWYRKPPMTTKDMIALFLEMNPR